MIKKLKIRNLVARSPLLRKGGVHVTPKQRKIDSSRLFRDAILEWEAERSVIIDIPSDNRIQLASLTCGEKVGDNKSGGKLGISRCYIRNR